jgi:hypothetical protein
MHQEATPQITEQVLALVTRTRDSLAHFGDTSVNLDGVFHHPGTQLAALKAARKHIEEAIQLVERRWGKAD